VRKVKIGVKVSRISPDPAPLSLDPPPQALDPPRKVTDPSHKTWDPPPKSRDKWYYIVINPALFDIAIALFVIALVMSCNENIVHFVVICYC